MPSEPLELCKREPENLEYSLTHYGDHFYLLTNAQQSTNFKLVKTPVDKTGLENWEDVIPHRENVLLEDVSIFKDFLVLEEREEGLIHIQLSFGMDREILNFLLRKKPILHMYTLILSLIHLFLDMVIIV